MANEPGLNESLHSNNRIIISSAIEDENWGARLGGGAGQQSVVRRCSLNTTVIGDVGIYGAISVTMAAICFVWLEPLMSRLTGLNSEIPMTTSDTSWLVASIEIGEVLTTIPAGLLADRYGRKIIILSTGPMCLVGWVLILTTRNLVVLFAVRMIQGIALAIVYTVVPMYIAEISEPRIRGELSGHFKTLWYMGILFIYVIGPLFDYQNYAYLCAILPIIFMITYAFMPESPYYYLMRRQPEKALRSLQWLRDSQDVDHEFKMISQSVEKDMSSKSSWGELFSTKSGRKAFFIVQLVCCIKYLNGMPAVTAYASDTFRRGSEAHTYLLTVCLGVILCLSCLGSALISDSIGRRPLLLVSIFGSVVFNILTAVYYYLADKTSVDVSDYYWVTFIAIGGFCLSANIGLGPLVQTMQAEYFSSNTRGVGSAITEVTAAVTTFVNLKQYQMVTDSFGVYMNYVIFAFFGTSGFIALFFTLSETAGKSLGEIQNEMCGSDKKKVDNDVVVIAET